MTREFVLYALDVTMPDGSVDDEVIGRGTYNRDGIVTWIGDRLIPEMPIQDAPFLLWYMAQYEYPDMTLGGGRWKFEWSRTELIPF